MKEGILVINSGSSSIKFSLFSSAQSLDLEYHGEINNIFNSPALIIINNTHKEIYKKNLSTEGYEAGLQALFEWLEHNVSDVILKGIGHRVVHAGQYFFQPTIITDDVIKKIKELIPLAPLHQPYNLEAITLIKKKYPDLLQVACFDTTFHQTQERLATLYPIPKHLSDEGIIRYGFHGISYEYIASVLTKNIGEIGNKRVIVAHLGNGCSMCGMLHRQSVTTTMGFTTLDGLMMGSRSGSIDPGILLYLMKEKNYSTHELQHLLYNKSGLLGVSDDSSSMEKLLGSDDIYAKEAIELFCYRAALEFGSVAVALGGCDALIFTAGIGENSAFIRHKICEKLNWLGVQLSDHANKNNEIIISDNNSKIVVGVIRTNEEYMIAKHVMNIH